MEPRRQLAGRTTGKIRHFHEACPHEGRRGNLGVLGISNSPPMLNPTGFTEEDWDVPLNACGEMCDTSSHRLYLQASIFLTFSGYPYSSLLAFHFLHFVPISNFFSVLNKIRTFFSLVVVLFFTSSQKLACLAWSLIFFKHQVLVLANMKPYHPEDHRI